MPLSSVAITGDIADQVGSGFDSRRTKIWVTTNVPDNTVIDTDGNKIRLGSGSVTLNSDGTFSASVWVPGTGSNPSSWQTYFHVDYPDTATRTRRTRTFGPFTITAAADLADLVEQQEVPPTYLSTVTAQLDTYVTEAEAARDAAVDISNISTSDGVVSALVEGTGGAGPLTRSALSASTDTHVSAEAVDDTSAIGAALAGVFSRIKLDPAKKYALSACGIRNVGGPNYWQPIEDSGHAPVNISSVSTTTALITVNYPAGTKVISAAVTPDEVLATEGYVCGASVGTSSVVISLGRGSLSDYISYDGSTWTAAQGKMTPGALGGTHAGELALTHDAIGGFGCALTPRGSAYRCVIGNSGGIGATQTFISFVDSAGAVATTPDTNMKVAVTRMGRGTINPQLVPPANHNIWLLVLIEIA